MIEVWHGWRGGHGAREQRKYSWGELGKPVNSFTTCKSSGTWGEVAIKI